MVTKEDTLGRRNDLLKKEAITFWEHFRPRLKKRDISDFVQFPLYVECFANKSRGDSISNAKEFKRKFNKMFDQNAIEQMLDDQNFHEKNLNNIVETETFMFDARAMRTVDGEKDGYSVRYLFKRTAPNTFKLIGIYCAG